MQANSAPGNTVSNLDVFDAPVRDYLVSQAKDFGYNPALLIPIIDVALEEAKKTTKQAQADLGARLLRIGIAEKALVFLRAVLSQSKKFRSARERIMAYSAVFITGAGISFESDIPLARILTDLLTFCGASSWEDLRKDPVKCQKFKLQFKQNCEGKQPGISHKRIVDGFPRYILEILCLNWDNLLEKAAQNSGKMLQKENVDRPVTDARHLWKFHGDVENIRTDNRKGQGGWIFPDEDGYVFTSFINYVEKIGIKDTMFTLVIVGYGENEKTITAIISLFENKPPRPTLRVGLDLSRLQEENYIVGPSDFVLKEILPS